MLLQGTKILQIRMEKKLSETRYEKNHSERYL